MKLNSSDMKKNALFVPLLITIILTGTLSGMQDPLMVLAVTTILLHPPPLPVFLPMLLR